MSVKKFQHLVPKTYLKHFVISNYCKPNHVWCLELNNEYLKHPIAKGINQKIFKSKNFYSLHNTPNKLLIEDFYAEKLEPLYNVIINEVNQQINLSEDIRIRIIEWLMHSNLRSEDFRDNFARLSKFLIDIYSHLVNQQELNKGKYKNITSNQIAKEIQLKTLLDPYELYKYFNLHYTAFKSKKWTILISNDDNPFIANDNPGFSLNLTHLGENFFNSSLQLSHISINYFILSPKYCLLFEPFSQQDNIKINGLNMEIKYTKLTEEEVNFINKGTLTTALKFIISNRFETINKWNFMSDREVL